MKTRANEGKKTGIVRAGRFSRRASGGFVLLLIALASVALFSIACGEDPEPTPTPSPAPTTAPSAAAEPMPVDDEALTRSYVEKAIEYYTENGLDATVAFYKSEAATQDGRTLILLNEAEGTLLVYRSIPTLEGQFVGAGSGFSNLGELITAATEEGHWDTARGINPATKQEEPRRVLIVLHDGLVFAASHSALTADVADSTK